MVTSKQIHISKLSSSETWRHATKERENVGYGRGRKGRGVEEEKEEGKEEVGVVVLVVFAAIDLDDPKSVVVMHK